MKVLRICLIIGYIALAIGAILYLINLIMAEEVISMAIVVPFYAIAFVGIICGIVFVVQSFRKKCEEIETVAKSEKTEEEADEENPEEASESEQVEAPEETEAAEEIENPEAL